MLMFDKPLQNQKESAMLTAQAAPNVHVAQPSPWALAIKICERIPPLWDLSNYVAVNPFVGFSNRPIAESLRIVADGLNARTLPDLAFYRRRWQDGAFGLAELEHAAQRAGQDPIVLLGILKGDLPVPLRPAGAVQTLAEQHDRQYGSAWNDTFIRSVTRWCGVYASDGGTYWDLPHTAQGLFAFWRSVEQDDRSLEVAGLKGWRAWVQKLPMTAEATIAQLLPRVPVADQEAYLYRLLSGVFGWASFLRREPWAAGSTEPGAPADLLAIRLCTDMAVAELAPREKLPSHRPPAPAAVEDESMRLIFQEALEDAYATRVLCALKPPATTAAARPDVQAIFCIDVRSEPFRRHFEAQSATIETRGFAGFFGITLEWETQGAGSARCPVLLKPGVSVRTSLPLDPKVSAGTLKDLQSAPAASFTFVETLGLAYGLGLAGDALAMLHVSAGGDGREPFSFTPDGKGVGIAAAGQLDIAEGMLKNMGLRDSYARLILLAGHESTSENNSHAAGLDCGACGGHGGAINARIAAAILNDSAVRKALPTRGYTIPDDTWFIPAVHDTTLDIITMFDTDRLPASHTADLSRLQNWLAAAGAQVRAERAGSLGIEPKPQGFLDRLIQRRAKDWSEVRPEWALARNAAFIAARRERSRGVNLQGRSFLHEYDWRTDPDNSILTLILSAPMVVASWINLQYFASTVDNDVFGCGTKALHNRLGNLGVVLGNGGDLRTGLALQSVHAPDGSWYHEPLRLQVVVEAPCDRIEAVFAASAAVRDLVENGWVRLFALSPDSDNVVRWQPGEGWVAA